MTQTTEAVTAPAPNSPEAIRLALIEAWLGMNYLGDILNGMDAATDRDVAISEPIIRAISQLAPEIYAMDIYATLGARHKEIVGNCATCLAPINWHEPRELLGPGKIAHVRGQCPAKRESKS
jgi:hypothetical protein